MVEIQQTFAKAEKDEKDEEGSLIYYNEEGELNYKKGKFSDNKISHPVDKKEKEFSKKEFKNWGEMMGYLNPVKAANKIYENAGEKIKKFFKSEESKKSTETEENPLAVYHDTPSFIGPAYGFENLAQRYGLDVAYNDGPIRGKYDGIQKGRNIAVNKTLPPAYKEAAGLHEVGHYVKGSSESDAHDFAKQHASNKGVLEALKSYEDILFN